MNTVLITGCSSGYGLETARHFHAHGWSVIATMRAPRAGTLAPSDRLRVLALAVTRPESIASAIQETASGFQIPGSGVIRAVGEQRGAWLLRCPALNAEGVLTLAGRQAEKEIELRVSNPTDMEVWIDGQVAGTSPLRKRVFSVFKQVRIKSAKGETVERWVPLFSDTEIDFPYPN